MSRLYIHLSGDYDTAVKVGMRHGGVVVLEVDTALMGKESCIFYLSENEVWLTEYIAPKYLTVTTRQEMKYHR